MITNLSSFQNTGEQMEEEIVKNYKKQVDAIFDKYEKFIVYDLTNINNKLLELPGIVSYYQNIFFSMQDKLDDYDYKRSAKWQEKFLYYKNEFDFALSTSEIKQFIERDVEIIDLNRKIARVKLIANRSEDTIKSLREFSWTLKHLIEYEKFKVGIV